MKSADSAAGDRLNAFVAAIVAASQKSRRNQRLAIAAVLAALGVAVLIWPARGITLATFTAAYPIILALSALIIFTPNRPPALSQTFLVASIPALIAALWITGRWSAQITTALGWLLIAVAGLAGFLMLIAAKNHARPAASLLAGFLLLALALAGLLAGNWLPAHLGQVIGALTLLGALSMALWQPQEH